MKGDFGFGDRSNLIESLRHKPKDVSADSFAREFSINFASILLSPKMGKSLRHGSDIYYFDIPTKQICLVPPVKSKGGDFWNMLTRHYNYTHADAHTQQVYPRLYSILKGEAQEASLSKFTRYKKSSNCLYVRKNNSEMFKISRKGIKVLPNGSNDVMFTYNSWMEDIDIDLEKDEVIHDSSFLQELLFDRVWFDGLAMPGYTAEHQQFIFEKYFYSLFFPSLLQQKPLFILQGDTGTGKTSTIANLGNILFGKNFLVSSLHDDKRDFVSSLANNHLLVLDNVDDNRPKWFGDTATAVSTGGGMEYRPLYADPTAPNVRIRPECFLAITTRTSVFNRADIANRAILNTLAKAPESQYDPNYQNRLLKNRKDIWLHILGELHNLLLMMKADKKQYSTSLRMIDFANFVIRTSEDKDEAKEILDKMGSVQQEYTAQNDPVLSTLRSLISQLEFGNDGDKVIYKFTVDQLHDLLSENAGHNIRNSYAVGKVMRKVAESAKGILSIDKQQSNGKTYYLIGSHGATKENTQIIDWNPTINISL